MYPGFHYQRAVPNWKEAVRLLPPGSLCVVVNDYFICKDIKAERKDLTVVFRKWWDDRPQWGGDYATEKQRARQYFDSFIDATWMRENIGASVDAVKELNEYHSSFNSEEEKRLIEIHLQAWADVWNMEYRGTEKTDGRDVPLVCLSTPVGNDADKRYAAVIYGSGNWQSYHGYTWVLNGVIGGGLQTSAIMGSKRAARRLVKVPNGSGGYDVYHDGLWLTDEQRKGKTMVLGVAEPERERQEVMASKNTNQEWQYYSGRHAANDDIYRAHNIYVTWCGTEGGPFKGVLDGWKHREVYNGDLEKYATEWVPYHMGRMANWNATHGNRHKGSALFTVDIGGVFDTYTHDAGQMNRLAQEIAAHAASAPPPDPPPPPPRTLPLALRRAAWEMTRRMQINGDHAIQLNPNAGIQEKIKKSGMQVVTTERDLQGWVFQAAEHLGGEKARRVYAYKAGHPITYFEDPG